MYENPYQKLIIDFWSQSRLNSPIPPRSSLLYLKIPGRNITNKHRKTERWKKEDRLPKDLGVASKTQWWSSLGFLIVSHVSDDTEASNLNHQQAQTEKLQEKPITLFQSIGKRGDLTTENIFSSTCPTPAKHQWRNHTTPTDSFSGVQLEGELLSSSCNNKSL